MPIGISLQLFSDATPQANLSDIQALWWDVVEPKDASRPVGKATTVTTDASGYISLDLSNVTGLSVGGYGFLMLYQKDGINSNDSLVFSGKVQTSTVASGVDMYYYDSGWIRPPDWLTLPDVTGLQKFAGLHAIYPESNFCALSAAGAYTVDWGDGVVENYAAGVTAYHQYNYATYDVAEATLCSRGYKQAIVTVVPQVQQNLTTLNLHLKHNQASLQAYSSGFLDIAVAGTLLSDLRVGDSMPGMLIPLIKFGLLEQFKLVGQNAVSNFATTFFSCYALQSIPMLNTAAGTDFSYMFSDCYSLKTIPLINTASGTHFSGMFSDCYYLQSIPLINTALCTNFGDMFNNCRTLQSIPLLNTAFGTDFSYMFFSCYALQSIPMLNTAAGTDFSGMFSYCASLQTIPMLNTAAGQNFSSMFSACYSLQTIPLLNTAAGTNFTQMFYYCYSLQTIPLINTAAGSSFSNMFFSCSSLQTIPLLNTAAGTNFINMFNGCSALCQGALSGTKESIYYSGCKLSPAALNAIYTNLGTVTAKTITVTNNWGTASDTPSIATAKGWTVTG